MTKAYIKFTVDFVVSSDAWLEWARVFTEDEVKEQIAKLGVEAFALYVEKIQRHERDTSLC